MVNGLYSAFSLQGIQSAWILSSFKVGLIGNQECETDVKQIMAMRPPKSPNWPKVSVDSAAHLAQKDILNLLCSLFFQLTFSKLVSWKLMKWSVKQVRISTPFCFVAIGGQKIPWLALQWMQSWHWKCTCCTMWPWFMSRFAKWNFQNGFHLKASIVYKVWKSDWETEAMENDFWTRWNTINFV